MNATLKLPPFLCYYTAGKKMAVFTNPVKKCVLESFPNIFFPLHIQDAMEKN